MLLLKDIQHDCIASRENLVEDLPHFVRENKILGFEKEAG